MYKFSDIDYTNKGDDQAMTNTLTIELKPVCLYSLPISCLLIE